MRLTSDFFDCDAVVLAQKLIGMLICRKYNGITLKAQIIETEAYAVDDKASHGSLGFTKKRQALFMAPGTIYMYYSRGSDSFNISAKGKGAAVLIKSAIVPDVMLNDEKVVSVMHRLNPVNDRKRDVLRLLSGQTLLCKALNITVKEWDQKQFNDDLYLEDQQYTPACIIATNRLGIPLHRDADLMYRYIDHNYVTRSTKNPLTMRVKPVYELIKPRG
ncbi:DNA-3-methyladenine glycosylase [Cysteiniphilum halobium]|uniref:DNA-3-methyladenine glycosylase n=1 Tax=Cysteiniphilum halobium TaxID=2219059 RepID=UPI000E656C4D|nr:DNA-3-methyladenine glycosylase [Cysteiniphilum halobium]